MTGPTAPLKAAQYRLLWSLAETQVVPGDRLEFVIDAADRREPEPQHSAASARTLQIVTADEKRRELDGYQAGMAQWLARVEDQHREAGEQYRDLVTQWSIAQQLPAADRDRIRELELQLRRLLANLTDARTGLSAQMQRVRDELIWNQLTEPVIAARCDRLTQHLTGLVDAQAPALGQKLAALQQAIGRPAATDPPPPDAAPLVDAAAFTTALTAAADAHAVIGTTLAAMLAELADWRRHSDASRTLAELLAGQQRLHEETRELAARTAARAAADLAPQEQADLARATQRQRTLADRTATLPAEAAEPSPGDASEQASTDLPADVATGTLAGRMSQAADFLAAHQLGQALDEQERNPRIARRRHRSRRRRRSR